MDVRTRIEIGKTDRDKVIGYVTKKEDNKIAYVTLPRDVEFKFPSDEENKEKQKEDEKSLDIQKDLYRKFLDRSKKRRGLPGWFSI